MPSTHSSLHFHIIFSVKHRQPLITAKWRFRLHPYLGAIINRLEGRPEAVGGTADHVHLLAGLLPKHTLADIVREVKASSSQWAHRTIGVKEFSWQDGYGAFTVSPSNIAAVKKYIAHQEEHHRKKTFQEEYLEFLRESGIQFDERYLW